MNAEFHFIGMDGNPATLSYNQGNPMQYYGGQVVPCFWFSNQLNYPLGYLPISTIGSKMEPPSSAQIVASAHREILPEHSLVTTNSQPPKLFQDVEAKEAQSKKKIINQNPKRNIVTNIGNQLITFISSKRKSEKVLRQLFPGLSNQEISDYYNFATRIKQESEYYLNLEKLRKMWYCRQDLACHVPLRKLLRQLSYHHLTHILPVSIISSRKMKSDSKLLHLKAKRVLVQQLRSPSHRFTFI